MQASLSSYPHNQGPLIGHLLMRDWSLRNITYSKSSHTFHPMWIQRSSADRSARCILRTTRGRRLTADISHDSKCKIGAHSVHKWHPDVPSTLGQQTLLVSLSPMWRLGLAVQCCSTAWHHMTSVMIDTPTSAQCVAVPLSCPTVTFFTWLKNMG